MNERKFLNRYQPQTLVSATMLCYVQAFFAFITLAPLLLVFALGLGFGGYGIANDKKWGYGLAVATAIVQVVLVLGIAGTDVFTFPLVLSFIFDIALVCLLLHPESRNYERIWFN